MITQNIPPPVTSPQPIWLTDLSVAALTGISVHTLRAHRQKRVGIAYTKIGRSVRYSLTDVQAFMASHRITFMEEHHV